MIQQENKWSFEITPWWIPILFNERLPISFGLHNPPTAYSYMNPRKILPPLFPLSPSLFISLSLLRPFSPFPSLYLFLSPHTYMYNISLSLILVLCSTTKQKAKYQADPERSLKTFVSRLHLYIYIYNITHTHNQIYIRAPFYVYAPA